MSGIPYDGSITTLMIILFLSGKSYTTKEMMDEIQSMSEYCNTRDDVLKSNVQQIRSKLKRGTRHVGRKPMNLKNSICSDGVKRWRLV